MQSSSSSHHHRHAAIDHVNTIGLGLHCVCIFLDKEITAFSYTPTTTHVYPAQLSRFLVLA